MSEDTLSQSVDIRQWWWAVMAISALVFVSLGSPIFIPDSYEHVILSECIGTGTSPRIDCSDIVYTFRPPLPALLLVGLSFLAHPLYGIVLISWFSVVLIPVLIWRFAPTTVSLMHRISMVLIMLAAPVFHAFSQLADARTIVLPMVLMFGLSLWRVLAEPNLASRYVFTAGLMVTLAALTRPESILLLPLGAVWVWLYARKQIRRYAMVTLLPLSVWWGILSKAAGQLVFAPRHWESTLLATWDFMPLRWAKQLYGMGLWSPPARQSVLLSTPASVVPDISIVEWVQWLVSGIGSCFAWWLWPIVIATIILGFRHREDRRLLGLLVICMAPNLLGALLPQARDPMFQISNLFPLWLMLLLLVGWGIGSLSMRVSKYRGVLIGAAVFTVWGSSQAPDVKNGIEFSAVGHQATQWLRDNVTSERVVISSFESAPVVFLAERRWEQWPSRWDQRRIFDVDNPILVVSSEDGFWTGNTYEGAQLPYPTAYFSIHNQWVVVYDMSDR